jgi:hypothetical protein
MLFDFLFFNSGTTCHRYAVNIHPNKIEFSRGGYLTVGWFNGRFRSPKIKNYRSKIIGNRKPNKSGIFVQRALPHRGNTSVGPGATRVISAAKKSTAARWHVDAIMNYHNLYFRRLW